MQVQNELQVHQHAADAFDASDTFDAFDAFHVFHALLHYLHYFSLRLLTDLLTTYWSLQLTGLLAKFSFFLLLINALCTSHWMWLS